MIIVRLMGGLGNQMFQYAAGRRLALLHNQPLKLDLTWFDQIPAGDTPRSFALHHFNIRAETATEVEIRRLTDRPGARGDLYRWLDRRKPWRRRIVLQERIPYTFDPDFVRVSGQVHLNGFWQNEGYFAPLAETLRQELTVKTPPRAEVAAWMEKIKADTSVSLHVRRADYASNSVTRDYHGVCSLEYYAAAVRQIEQCVGKAHYFVFSDDPEWAQANFKFNIPLMFVTGNDADHDYEDLRLMTLCQHHIIANSSFSWWGAWLCANSSKVVIAPKRWVNVDLLAAQSIVPAAWLRL